jgi:hypothetical protein
MTKPIKEQVMKTLRLNNGYEIPVVGKEGHVFLAGLLTIFKYVFKDHNELDLYIIRISSKLL